MDNFYPSVAIDEFFREFLPDLAVNESQLRSCKKVETSSWEQNQERSYYRPICKAVNSMLRKVGLKEYVLLITGDLAENGEHDRLKPDLCLYRRSTKDADSEDAYMHPKIGEKKKPLQVTGEDGDQYDARTAWAWIVTLVEVKASSDAHPFLNFTQARPELELTIGAEGSAARAQMVSYATELQLRQHRISAPTAFIHQRHVRFMYWDKTGAVVSYPVDYIKDPKPLFRFFCCVALADKHKNGRLVYEPTAALARNDEIKPMEDLRDRLEHETDIDEKSNNQDDKLHWQRLYLNDILDNEVRRFHPIYKITCDDVPDPEMPESQTQTKSRVYLIGKHIHGSQSPLGRGSRGYVAFDVDRKELVFMKDYWCAQADGIHPELEIYKELRRCGVNYVPTVLAGGNVGGKELILTRSQDFMGDRFKRIPKPRFRQRLVLKELGRPLWTFKDQHELLESLYYAYHAHKEAWEKANILHRDVSESNIMIDVRTNKAFLADWDLCKYKSELGKGATQHGRSGTWPFLSAALLKWPRKPAGLSDDLESFVHVATYMGLRFFGHSLSQIDDNNPGRKLPENNELKKYTRITYHDSTRSGEYTVGGEQKYQHFGFGKPGFTFDKSNRPLQMFVQQAYTLFGCFYRDLDVAKYDALYGVRRARGPVPDEDDEFADVLPSFLTPAAPTPTPVSSRSPSPSPTPIAVQTESKPRLLADMTHRDIEILWEQVMKVRSWPQHDKTRDQFEGLDIMNPTNSSKHFLDVQSNSGRPQKRSRSSGAASGSSARTTSRIPSAANSEKSGSRSRGTSQSRSNPQATRGRQLAPRSTAGPSSSTRRGRASKAAPAPAEAGGSTLHRSSRKK